MRGDRDSVGVKRTIIPAASQNRRAASPSPERGSWLHRMFQAESYTVVVVVVVVVRAGRSAGRRQEESRKVGRLSRIAALLQSFHSFGGSKL